MGHNEDIAGMKVQIDMLQQKANDQETRLRGVEKVIWMAFGVSALFQTIIVVGIEYFHK